MIPGGDANAGLDMSSSRTGQRAVFATIVLVPPNNVTRISKAGRSAYRPRDKK